MKSLIKISLTFITIFISALILVRYFNLLTIDDIRALLAKSYEISSFKQFLIVVSLLTVDILITIPTLIVSTLSGHYLGFTMGSLATSIGLTLSGLIGFLTTAYFRNGILKLFKVEQRELREIERLIDTHGIKIICIARAIPMLPELLSCLCGLNKVPLKIFLTYWLVGSLPYALILNYAGSISTINKPYPALLAAFFVSSVLGVIAWRIKRLQPLDS